MTDQPLKPNTCSTCAAFHRANVVNIGAPGQCRLNPPSVPVMTGSGPVVIFAPTQPEFWRQQWRPHNTQVN